MVNDSAVLSGDAGSTACARISAVAADARKTQGALLVVAALSSCIKQLLLT